MSEIAARLGRETGLDELNTWLHDHVVSLAAPVVGAMHVTCADESEWECVDSFQRCFVQKLLPELKHATKTPFRLSNLGARYEIGALAVAEHHYATPDSADAYKVLLVKINAHVAAVGSGADTDFGAMDRYGTESAACGALHALLGGATEEPFLDELRRTFTSHSRDRLSALLDEERVAPRYRSLFVSLVSARLQTERLLADIRQHEPASPTLYLIATCLTLNRPEEDTEILCGFATADYRTAERREETFGLGDDPTRYVVGADAGRLLISERE